MMRSHLLVLGVVLAWAGAVPAADPKNDAFGDPLPEGAVARLGTSRMRFPDGTRVVFLPPDYKEFLATGPDGLVRRHEAATGRPLPGDGFPGEVIAVSGDGNRVAVRPPGLAKNEVRDLRAGRVVHFLDERAGESFGSFSADGKRVAIARLAEEARVVVWDTERAAEVGRIDTGFRVHPAAVLSPDGAGVAVWPMHVRDRGAGHPYALRIWDVGTGKMRLEVPRDGKIQVAFSPDGKTLALTAPKGIDLCDLPSGRLRAAAPGPSGLSDPVAFAADGRSIAALGPVGEVWQWTADGREARSTRPPDGLPGLFLPSLGVGAGGRAVVWGQVVGRASSGPRERVPVAHAAWEAPARKFITPRPRSDARPDGFGFAAGGREVVTAHAGTRVTWDGAWLIGSGPAVLTRWDAATGKPLGTLPPPERPVIGPASRVLVGSDAARRIATEFDWEVFDRATGKSARVPPRPEGLDPGGWGLTFSDDFRLAASLRHPPKGGPGRCEVWDVPANRRLSGFDLPPGARGGWPSGSFNRSGSRLVLVVQEWKEGNPGPSAVAGWDAGTGEKLGLLALAPAGRGWEATAAVPVGTGTALVTTHSRLWAVDYEGGREGEVIDTFEDHGQAWYGPRPPPVVVAPGEAWFAYGLLTGRPGEYGVTVRDWPRGKVLKTFAGHAGPVTVVVASPDGKTLATGSTDTTVLLWDVADLAPKK